MSEARESLPEHIDVLEKALAAIRGDARGMPFADDGDLLSVIPAAQSVILSAQGIIAAAAGEVARRSQGSKDSSLARQLGERSAIGLVASRGGIPFRQASQYVAVGEMIRPNLSLAMQLLPPDREHVADAVLAGRLPLPVAELIDETVHQVEHRMMLDEPAQTERELVDLWLAGQTSFSQFTLHCRQLVDILDPDGAKPRADDLKSKSSLRETWLKNGGLKITAELDPELAAFWKASIGAKTNPRRSGEDQSDSNDRASKDRTQASRMESRLHAFIRILRDSLKAEDGPQAGIDTTILVRIDLDSLLTGLGTATIDGIATPISAATARRLAAEADLIPQVFGGKSQLLDQGEARRVFTKAQRYAILSEFTGCTFPGCGIPSSMVEFHHIEGWAGRHRHGKSTDVANGLPLCGFHNRLMDQGWKIEFDDQHVPWFTPPAHIDFWQRPTRGGNIAPGRAA